MREFVKAVTEIRVAIAGVGNVTSAFLQGLHYYKNRKLARTLLHPELGGFKVDDIKIVAAFDMDITKVGKDLAEAIFSTVNTTPKVVDVPPTGVIVHRAPTLDGISEYAAEVQVESPEPPADMLKVIKESKADMLVCMVSSGSIQAVEQFAQLALDAEIGFINAVPHKVASDPTWARKFASANLPVVGDDFMSQVGGTIVHRNFLEALDKQGLNMESTYQLDVSGGLEGLNTLDYTKKAYKRSVKEEAIKRTLRKDINVAAGTTDYLDFLQNRRIGHFFIKGTGFMDLPVTIDIRMESYDGANGAATLVDVVRAMKLALTRVVAGPVHSISAHYFKYPPVFSSVLESEKWFKEFIDGSRQT